MKISMRKTSIKFFVTLLFVGVLGMITGCASLPSPELMKAEAANYRLPKLPDPGKAIVYVVRPSNMGTLIRFNVFVDDQEAGSEMGFNRGNQYIYFNLKPGNHTIYSKAENWAELAVSVQAGDIVFIQQDPAMGIVMARNSIFKVEDYQGKYQVKSATLGTILKTDRDPAGSRSGVAALPMSAADAERLAGNWSGTYSCGAYLGPPGATANPAPFVAKVQMTVQGNRASVTRSPTNIVTETVSGDIATDLISVLRGEGAMVGDSKNVWRTQVSGSFSAGGTVPKFTGDGSILNNKGMAVRECKVNLSK